MVTVLLTFMGSFCSIFFGGGHTQLCSLFLVLCLEIIPGGAGRTDVVLRIEPLLIACKISVLHGIYYHSFMAYMYTVTTTPCVTSNPPLICTFE